MDACSSLGCNNIYKLYAGLEMLNGLNRLHSGAMLSLRPAADCRFSVHGIPEFGLPNNLQETPSSLLEFRDVSRAASEKYSRTHSKRLLYLPAASSRACPVQLPVGVVRCLGVRGGKCSRKPGHLRGTCLYGSLLKVSMPKSSLGRTKGGPQTLLLMLEHTDHT